MKMSFFTPLLFVVTLAVSACSSSKKNSSDYISRARAYTAAGDLAKAQVELRNAVAVNPNDPEVNLALAKVEDEAGDLQAAVPHYLRAAAPEANLIEPQLRIVQILVDSERLLDASGRINATLGAFPDNPDALALRADIAERQGQLRAAKLDADAALQKDRSSARALSVLAMLALRSKEASAALEFVERGLKQHPADLRLLQVQAATLVTMNQPEKAVEALKLIVQTAPRNVAVQTALAQIEVDSGRSDDALANFRAAVVANPANQDMQLAFIAFLARQNKEDDVVATLRGLIVANPSLNTYDLVLAEYYRGRDQLDQAKDVLDRAASRLAQGKGYLDIKVALAKLDAARGLVDVALDGLNAILAADPQHEEALLYRAILNAEGGRSTAAIEDLLKVVRSNPVNARAFQTLATAYLLVGEPQLAVGAMQRAVAVVPGDEGAQIRLASFLQQAGQIDPARDVMARLLLQRPESVSVWVVNGQLAVDRQDWPTASRSVARLKELPGASSAALALDGRLKAARGDNDAALQSYRAAIETDSNPDPVIMGAFARVSAINGQAKDAADLLEQRVGTLKGDGLQQAWSAIMTLRADAGQFEEASVAFQNALRLSPRRTELYIGYVQILLSQRKLKEASDVTAAGLRAGASKTSLLLLIGTIHEMSGDLPAAKSTYQDALASNPLSLQAANNYGSLLADLEPKNTEALRRARATMGGAEQLKNASILDTMAWLDYRLGQFDEAKKFLIQINAAQSSSPQIRFHLAAVLLASGDKTGGLALLDSVKGLKFSGSDEVRRLSDT